MNTEVQQLTKTLLGQKLGNTIPYCRLLSSTSSSTNRFWTKSYKHKLKLKPYVLTLQTYIQGIGSMSEMNQNYPKLLQLQQTRTSHKPQNFNSPNLNQKHKPSIPKRRDWQENEDGYHLLRRRWLDHRKT